MNARIGIMVAIVVGGTLAIVAGTVVVTLCSLERSEPGASGANVDMDRPGCSSPRT